MCYGRKSKTMDIMNLKHKKWYKYTTIFIIVVCFLIPSGIKGNVGDFQEGPLSLKSDTDTVTPSWYNKPGSYAELVEWYQTLENNFPEYLEVFKANEFFKTGKVDGGYDLYYVRITNEALGFHKPEVLFLGSPHGDETVGTIGLYWFTNWLMRKAYTTEPCCDYSKDWLQWLVDHREIYIVVSQNPYGFDMNRRHDKNGWDLNREADYDGPGQPTGGIWGSTNGKTLRAFIDNHTIRVGCDFHDGARMILYPWSSNHDNVFAVSKISGKEYSHVPPDFNFFDASALRLGSFMGTYGGILNKNSIGTIPDIVGYEAPGALCPWAYGADVKKHPNEDPYVNDETFGNYPGAGILWLSPEMSRTKNPSESAFGNDTIDRYGAEVRRFVLHQTDLAQPYIRWTTKSTMNNTVVQENTSLTFQWQVNGSLVVDNTSLQWSKINAIENPQWVSENLAENDNGYTGGTGWEKANDGKAQGVTYEKTVTFDETGDYYFVAKAKVDQIYKNIIEPHDYENTSYLRIVNERTNSSYIEILNGTDGVEKINGNLWWYGPVIHVIVADNIPEFQIEKPTNAFYFKNKKILDLSLIKNPVIFGNINITVNVLSHPLTIENITFYINDDVIFIDNQAPYFYNWDEKTFGSNIINVVLNCKNGANSNEEITIWKFF